MALLGAGRTSGWSARRAVSRRSGPPVCQAVQMVPVRGGQGALVVAELRAVAIGRAGGAGRHRLRRRGTARRRAACPGVVQAESRWARAVEPALRGRRTRRWTSPGRGGAARRSVGRPTRRSTSSPSPTAWRDRWRSISRRRRRLAALAINGADHAVPAAPAPAAPRHPVRPILTMSGRRGRSGGFSDVPERARRPP